VLIRIHAVSLNFRDLMIINGQYGDTPPPFVPVADGAGAKASPVGKSRIA